MNECLISCSFEDFGRYVRTTEYYKDANEEMLGFNIRSEYEALDKITDKSKYSHALYNVCKYIIACVEKDSVNGDYRNETNKELMIEAGLLLYEDGGVESMCEVLDVWIPKRYHVEIDGIWSGVAGWRS